MEAFNHLRVPLEFIMRATENFSGGNYIARGGYGKVYKGEFLHLETQSVGAVKLLDRSKEQVEVSFLREIMLLSSYRHENLISLLGFCDEGENRILVYEYACNKSLDFHLLSPSLTWIQRLKICVGAACGLEYLHDPKGTQKRVLHRDIKSANILLDQDWNAKIADFGLSKHGPANQEHTFLISEAKGTLGYCDPVFMETMIYKKESDVYSFGVVLFEVLCSRPCVDWRYEDERRCLPVLVKKCEQEQRLHTIIDDNLRQQIDQDCFKTFVALAKQCLEREQKMRPTMESVVRKLKIALEYQEDFEAEEYLDDEEDILSNPNLLPAFEHEKFEVEEDSDNEQERELSLQPSLKLKKIQDPVLSYEKAYPPGGRNSVILYTTTFRLIPKSFKDCSSILSLLESLEVVYEERDLSMHAGFVEELHAILGSKVVPPQLFIKGRYIGGAEEVLWLHEQGKFQPLLAGIPQNTSQGKCKACDGIRFVICVNCNGSNMVGGKLCVYCNERGLAKCPNC